MPKNVETYLQVGGNMQGNKTQSIIQKTTRLRQFLYDLDSSQFTSTRTAHFSARVWALGSVSRLCLTPADLRENRSFKNE